MGSLPSQEEKKKAGRYSGGITVLVKSHLRGGVKIAHCAEGFLWIKLCKTFFHLPKDLYMCGVYIPPYNSSKEILAKTDYFHEFLRMTNEFLGLGNVLIAGDMNSRIGCDSDDLPNSSIAILEDIIPSFCNTPPVPKRSSCDRTMNQYGRKMNRLCLDLGLTVVNGRVPGDLLGNFTCFTSRGRSVVDLVLSDSHLFRNVQHLKVLPPEYTSVHCPISTMIHCPIEFEQQTSGEEFPLNPKIIWDSSKVSVLRKSLLSPPGKATLLNLTTSVTKPDSDSGNVDESVREFGKFLVGEAKRCMKTSSGKRKKRERKTRKGFKWYSNECSAAKTRLENQARLL